MTKERLRIAAGIWFISNILFDACLVIYFFIDPFIGSIFIIPGFFAAALGSLPILLILFFLLPFISRKSGSSENMFWKVFLICVLCALLYGLMAALVILLPRIHHADFLSDYIKIATSITGILSAIAFMSLLVSKK